MKQIIEKFILTLSQLLGVPVTMYSVKLLSSQGTLEMGVAFILLVVTVGLELWAFRVRWKWKNSNIYEVESERVNEEELK